VRGQATWLKPEYDGLRFVGNNTTFENVARFWNGVQINNIAYPEIIFDGSQHAGSLAFRKNGVARGDLNCSDSHLIFGHFSALMFRANGADVVEVLPSGMSLNAGKTLMVNGQQVVGPRRVGWTTATGSPNRGSFAAAPAGTASASYVQSEAQDERNRIAALEARLIALESDCRSHGLIN
jgi:hypothetical protein